MDRQGLDYIALFIAHFGKREAETILAPYEAASATVDVVQPEPRSS